MAYEVKAILSASASGFTKGFHDAKKALESFSSGTESKLQAVGGVMQSAGKAMTVGLTAPLAAIRVASVKFAAEFESAMTGVAKTVDMTADEFDAMSKSIQGMSREIPASTKEIAAVAEAAGQLGIKKESILDFTRTMIDMGEATNLSSEEAASSLAQFANITGMTQDKFSNLGSTIVALGNSFATTEADIVRMGHRLAGTGSMVGLTEAEIMGLSTAMSSVGINAEAGGSAFSRVMQKMNSEVLSSGDKLQDFAKIAGMSASEFSAAWKEKPSEAITAFVDGLERVKDSGGDVTSTLEELGISSVQEIDTLMRLAGAADLLPDAFDLATQAFDENSALAEEAAQRYQTFESQFQIFKNAVTEAGQQIGIALLPVLADMVKHLTGVAQAFSDLPEPVKKAIVIFGVVLAAVGPLLMLFGGLIAALPMLAAGFAILGPAISAIGSVFAVLLSPLGLVVAAIAAVVAIIMHLWKTNEGFRNAITTGWQAIQSVVSSVSGAIVSVVKSAWDGMKNVISTVMSAIQGDTDAQWQVISTLIQVALTVIQTVVSGGWNIVQSITNTILGALSGVVSSAWESVKSAVSSAMDNIKSTVSSKWESVKSATVSALSAMVSGVTSGMANVVSAISSGMEGALSAVTGFVGQFQSVGSNIVNAVASGISAGASAAISAAASMARAALNAAKSALGIHSPSREFLEVGSQVVAGLVKGIDGNARKAIQSTHAMGLDVLNSMPTMSFDVGGKVSSLSSLPQQMVSLSVDKNRNQGGQSASIVLNLGNRAYQAFVGDITKQQDSTADLIATYS